MISYYDLIGMVKEGDVPGTIEVKLCFGKAKTYIAEYDGRDFNYYHLEFEDLEDDNYHYYLSEYFLESSMFDKCIKILDEEDDFIDIEELSAIGLSDPVEVEMTWKINDLIKNQRLLINKLKEEGK